MPPVRPRILEDSRSEASSTITNIKERSAMGLALAGSILKGKKTATSALNGASKPTTNGAAAAQAEQDPSQPRTDWSSFPPTTLQSYRHAHNLPTASSHTHPHADILYRSSRTALHSPSSVLARRKLRDLKHERRKNTSHHAAKGKDRERSRDRLKTLVAMQPTETGYNPDLNPLRQPMTVLSKTVRQHFNAQQLNESDVLARFLYVVHHSSAAFSPATAASTEGSGGDGRGAVVGSHGRQLLKNDGAAGPGGGDLGFRLRFRP